MNGEGSTKAAAASSSATAGTVAEDRERKVQRNRRQGIERRSTSSGANAPAAEEVIADLISTDFGVHKSLRYHAKRRAFFDSLHRFAMAIIAITGSAAFFTFFSDASTVSKVAALFAAVASVLELTMSFPERAREHGELYQRFSDLAARLARLDPGTIEPSVLRELRAERLIIEADEPIAMTALNILCHNEEAEARGYGSDEIYRIGWLQRMVMQFGTLPWFKVEKVSTATQI